MIMMLDETERRACEPMRAAGASCSRGRNRRGALAPTPISTNFVRLVNAIGLATEDAPDREAQADRLFALMMDGVRP